MKAGNPKKESYLSQHCARIMDNLQPLEAINLLQLLDLGFVDRHELEIRQYAAIQSGLPEAPPEIRWYWGQHSPCSGILQSAACSLACMRSIESAFITLLGTDLLKLSRSNMWYHFRSPPTLLLRVWVWLLH